MSVVPIPNRAAIERGRRIAKLLYRGRRVLATVGVCVLAVMIGYHAIFGANGWVAYDKKRTEYRDVQKQLDDAQTENRLLNERVKALQTNPAAIEREAREQLHYAKPGEAVYLLPQPRKTDPPPNAAAQKR